MYGESPIQMNESHSFDLSSASMSSILQRVFLMMMGGLGVTALTSFIALNVPSILLFTLESYIILLIAELIVVIFLSARIAKMGSGTAVVSFVLYSIINGLTLTPIFLIYTGTSIATVFLITAATFGISAFIGKVTKMDLSKFGSYLMMALIGLIVAGLVNLFMQNTMLDFWISVIGIVVFIGLTAYDVQKIKEYSTMVSGTDEEVVKKLSIMGALELYLDFINIFLKLLRLMGRSRRD